jgi:hypothetical protein
MHAVAHATTGCIDTDKAGARIMNCFACVMITLSSTHASTEVLDLTCRLASQVSVAQERVHRLCTDAVVVRSNCNC